MPKLTKSLPKYRKHKARGQAIVTLDGKDFYLGPYKSSRSHREYDRLVGEWQHNGRRLPVNGEYNSLAVSELLNSYYKFAQGYYRKKNGKPTGTIVNIRPMLKLVRKYYGHTMAHEFGPLALKSLQSRMIEQGLSRNYINMQIGRIRRMFRWATSEEMIPVSVLHGLQSVSGLRQGRTEARETDPVLPVDDSDVEATLRHLPTVVADMVRFQRLTGCRPDEVCIVRPCDVDTSADVWIYRPEWHKTEHHGRDRAIPIGPQAQDVLRRYLFRESTAYCFSPAASELQRLRDRQAKRTTPLKYGNRAGTNRRRRRKRAPGAHYTTGSYRRAVHRACNKAFPPPSTLSDVDSKESQREHRWCPNRLRHTAATDFRKKFGLEAAQVVLGHIHADVTQIYAERDLSQAIQIAREVG